MLQKFNELGYGALLHLPYSLDLLPSDYHFFKPLFLGNFFFVCFFQDNFFQVKHFHNQQEAENAFQEFTDFYSIGKNKLFSYWQKYVDMLIVIVLILINEDVFEPS